MKTSRMSVGCPVCGGKRTRVIREKYGRALVSCAGCRAAFLFPRPSREELLEAARAAAAERIVHERDGKVIEAMESHARGILDVLRRRGCSGSLLDVGCGRGIFLDCARKHGWRARGVEPAREVAEEGICIRKLDIFIGEIGEANFPESSFDAVIFSHSLEHTADPAGGLRSAARLLREGGWVYIETPNWLSLSRRILGTRWWNVDFKNHPYIFSPGSLELLLRGAGLSPQESHGIHFDAPAVLIRLAHFFRDDYSSIYRINECRDRLLGRRGAWKIFSSLDRLAGAVLGRSMLDDYCVFWSRK